MPSESNYSRLFNRLLEGKLSPEDTESLVAWLSQSELDEEAKQMILAQLKRPVDKDQVTEEMITSLESRLPAILGSEVATPVRRLHFYRKDWFKYAAIFVLFAGSVAYFWSQNKPGKEFISNKEQPVIRTDIAPGNDKAILTLADGTQVALDTAEDGNLFRQGNTSITKLGNGEIVYNSSGYSKEALINTMSTPVGGQYRLTLPDGTKVWLNAASSITYPTFFAAKERAVKISGEVYFEVIENKEKPFIVDIDGRAHVRVLGTSFNVNSYSNEGSIKTTLIEGSVKISKANKAAFLRPGQQALISTTQSESIMVKSDINLGQALAWKDGMFDFNDAALQTVMRQLERWYDIDVKYEGNVPEYVFKGKMYRNVNLSDVLEALQRMGLKFRINGRTLVITG